MSSTLSVRDLCERYGVSAHTVLNWIHNGELKAVNVGRRPGAKNRAGALHKQRWRHSRLSGHLPRPRPRRGERSVRRKSSNSTRNGEGDDVNLNPEAGAKARLLITLLSRGPKTWAELERAGLTRSDVFAEVDRLTLAEEAVFRVGPLLVERLDREADA